MLLLKKTIKQRQKIAVRANKIKKAKKIKSSLDAHKHNKYIINKS